MMKTNNRKKPLGIYIHIPFCVQKCRYCDFLSFANENADTHAEYVKKLEIEISGRSLFYRNDYYVDSIYIGGGTPSLIDPRRIDDILDAIYSRFDVSDDAEITIEVNPGTIAGKSYHSRMNPDMGQIQKFQHYLDSGINRISMGIQSFDDAQLKYLGRIHDAEQAVRAYDAAVKAGFENINIDLIFGLPGESFDVWKRDIKAAVALDPGHISFYSLTVEEGTPVFDDIAASRVEELGEIEDRLMYHRAIEYFAASGYEHYEISNAAKPGKRSRHNLKYWSMDDYLGFGLGAHSYINGSRFANTSLWKDYFGAESHRFMTDWIHENTVNDEISEFVFLGLRKTEGIDLNAFENRFGKNFMDIFSHETEELIGRGLLERDSAMLRLTSLGLDLSNRVFVEFV